MKQITNRKELLAYKKRYNFFETNSAVAAKAAELLDGVGYNARILDPSIGRAALPKAVKTRFSYPIHFDYCEIQEDFYTLLGDYNRVGTDFMEYNPGPVYDAVIMNPPYRNGIAQNHVDHAWDCTKLGGRIVALVGKACAGFLDREFSGHVFHREVFEKAFSETNITTYLFLIHKPLYT
jgi:hypothetical protein